MKNLLKLSIMLAALLVLTGTNNVIAQEVINGVSNSDTEAGALPGSIDFGPPCSFNQTLPLETYMNSGTNAVFVVGNGAVLDECSNFGVNGHSSPNFLAYNPGANNADGSIPALPAVIYFTNPVTNFSLLAGAGGGTTGTVILAAFDAGFNLVVFDTTAIDPTMQNLSVTWGPGIQAAAVVGQFTGSGETMVLDNLSFQDAGCILGTDSDNDRLDDCYETNTGVYVSPTNTGTDPNNPDTDGDYLKDGDEVLGTVASLDLPAMGADPLRKDVFCEFDWFNDSLECGSHSHRPTAAAINEVAAAFANSPVPNPDGSTGVNFHGDYGQGGIFTGGNQISDADGVLVGGVNSSEFMNHKSNNFDSKRHGYFFYCILPHRYNTSSSSSGQAELPGDDFIVSLYCSNSNHNVAHTIMHEWGHNANLRHGGNVNCNYKPNYNSVMNYKYQFPGIDNDCTPPGNGVLNYSIGDRITLNENNLNEFNGTCGPGNPWDWNGNSIIESSVAFDINPSGNSSCGSTFSILGDYNDWGNIIFTGLSNADGAFAVPPEIIDCDNPAPSN